MNSRNWEVDFTVERAIRQRYKTEMEVVSTVWNGHMRVGNFNWDVLKWKKRSERTTEQLQEIEEKFNSYWREAMTQKCCSCGRNGGYYMMKECNYAPAGHEKYKRDGRNSWELFRSKQLHAMKPIITPSMKNRVIVHLAFRNWSM